MVQGLIAVQCRTARAALGWTQQRLIEQSGVGSTSVKRFELGAPLHQVLVDKLRSTLETAGVVFLDPGSKHEGRTIRLGLVVLEP